MSGARRGKRIIVRGREKMLVRFAAIFWIHSDFLDFLFEYANKAFLPTMISPIFELFY